MTWAEISAIVAIATVIGGIFGWMLPSPIEMQTRISTLEKDVAVLVRTVDTLRSTVEDWIKFMRQQGMNGNGDSGGGSGRRSRI